MFFIPGVALSPTFQNRFILACDAPINGEKCGFEGKSWGWVSSLHVALKVSLYWADEVGFLVGAGVTGGFVVVVVSIIVVVVW
jgi:hypothetical protein